MSMLIYSRCGLNTGLSTPSVAGERSASGSSTPTGTSSGIVAVASRTIGGSPQRNDKQFAATKSDPSNLLDRFVAWFGSA